MNIIFHVYAIIFPLPKESLFLSAYCAILPGYVTVKKSEGGQKGERCAIIDVIQGGIILHQPSPGEILPAVFRAWPDNQGRQRIYSLTGW